VEADNKEFSIKLIGFKTTGLTTTLKEKEISVKDIEGLKDKKASEIKNDENGTNNSTLKTKIKDLIQDTFLGNKLENDDIEIILDQVKINDAKGTLDVKVKVKNDKSWENGEKKEKEFELKLVGFKIQAATEVVNFEIKDLNRDILKKYYATPYEKINSSTKQDSTTQDKGIKDYLKEELNKKVNNIFKNIPQETKIKTLEINDHSIGSIQNGYDAAHGAVYIVVTLDKYYDENGIEKNNSSSPSSKNDEGKFYFKISGFKVDENINTYLDSALYDPTEWNSINLSSSKDSQTSYQDETTPAKNIEETKASEWKSNINLIKTKFEEKLHGTNNELQQKNGKKFTNIKNKVYGDEKWASATEVNGEASIEIDQSQTGIHDDVRGTLILEVTFKNLWWKNGVFIKEHKERIRFSGFNSWENDENFKLDKAEYNPYLSIVEEEIKQKDGTTTKEKIAIINVSEEHGNLDLISWLQQNSLESKEVEAELNLKQNCENNFKLQMEEKFNELEVGVLGSPILETFLVGVKNKIISEDNYNGKWCKVENVSFNVKDEEWKITSKNSKTPIADSVDFTIKT
ncbi:MAG: hypothetical protein IJ970_00745, partial [Mycoplasmataceae bacterium]|nr:hypothetical protein [Mycoplasmataceae bacterium]